MLENILIAYYSFTEPTISGLNSWIASFINLFPSIVLGVVMFTVALKLITFPLDFYSRASMRRNSLKMEQMRPQLEKLQQQYADDKQTYQMKMAALYKKEGYSMFGACLPSIITLVFFIIVLQAFNTYSIYQNIAYLYNMNTAFNSVVEDGVESVQGYISREDGKLVIDDAAVYTAVVQQEGENVSGEEIVLETEGQPDIVVRYVLNETDGEGNVQNYVSYETENGYIEYFKQIRVNEDGSYSYSIDYASTRLILDKFKGNTSVLNERRKNFSKTRSRPVLRKSTARKRKVFCGSKTSGCPIPPSSTPFMKITMLSTANTGWEIIRPTPGSTTISPPNSLPKRSR